MTKRLHVLLAEPSLIIRNGLISVLSRIELPIDLAQIEDVKNLPIRLSYFKPDILIVNPIYLGFDAFRNISYNANLKRIALQNTLLNEMLLTGYDGSISIDDDADTIKNKLSSLIKTITGKYDQQTLSEREREIVVCVVKGLTNKQIADQLFLSPHTVMTHRRNIASKLQIHSTSGLTIYAIVNKLIKMEELKDTIK